jgi:hypothetical protein
MGTGSIKRQGPEKEKSVVLGAIVAIGAKNHQWFTQDAATPPAAAECIQESLLLEPLECMEIAGRSAAERMVERFAALDATVSVLVESAAFVPWFRTVHENVTVQVVSDLNFAIRQKLSDYSQQGIEHAFVNWANSYQETDLLDLFCFHRESRQAATPTFDREGPLALWAVDCAKAQQGPIEKLLYEARLNGASQYFIREYVNCLNHPRDLRRFASDMLRGQCQARPRGQELRPGVWLDEGAEIHRRARVVAPAYVGRGSKVRADALITRFSDIERDCCIDCGTVVEDSSVLPNTTVGIWLDLCHAVASGNILLNLERDVLIEISDSRVLRSTNAGRKFVPGTSERLEPLETISQLEPRRMPEAWQLGSNFIQE